MNPHPQSPRAGDNFLRLAGLADGELDPHTQCQLEQWLEEHPEAQDALQNQERFAPAHTEFWAAMAPPEPSADAWLRVQNQIERELAASFPIPMERGFPRKTRNGTLRWGAGAGLLAASLILVWIGFTVAPSHPAPTAPAAVTPWATEPTDPLAGVTVLHMADADDVFVEAVYGTPPLGWTEYDSPLMEEFSFAGRGDVDVERIRNVEPGIQVGLHESDSGMPMIYAVSTALADETSDEPDRRTGYVRSGRVSTALADETSDETP